MKNHWAFRHYPENNVQLVLFSLVVGLYQGIAGTCGHELFHHKHWFNKFMGNLPYIVGLYGHFGDEHVQGHHKYIATDEDPVSAGFNESIYYCWFKAFFGT
jgi:alkane 1-monooxygenase